MRDIIKLLFGDGESGGSEPQGWDEPRRRARIDDSRDWCGTTPGEDTLGALAAALGGRGRGRPVKHVVVVRGKRRF
jgi:hypothetical protein